MYAHRGICIGLSIQDKTSRVFLPAGAVCSCLSRILTISLFFTAYTSALRVLCKGLQRGFDAVDDIMLPAIRLQICWQVADHQHKRLRFFTALHRTRQPAVCGPFADNKQRAGDLHHPHIAQVWSSDGLASIGKAIIACMACREPTFDGPLPDDSS